MRSYPWTAREYTAVTRDPATREVMTGEWLFGRHRGMPFRIEARYPVADSATNAPRLRAVLGSWIWSDTRTALAADAPVH